MSKSTRSRSASKSRGRTLVGRSGAGRGRGTAADAVETFTRPNKTLPVVLTLIAWRWRWELILLAGCLTAGIWLHTQADLDGTQTLVLLAYPLIVLLAVGPSRRFLRNRFWCVVTRHRVRACLTEMRTLNYSGNIPFIAFCRSTKVGESVWLWMRPGLSELDLKERAENFASACWARDARIERARWNAALIRIDIDRRDPLSKKHITSPLIGDTADLPHGEVIQGAVLQVIRDTPSGADRTTDSGPVPTTTANQQPAPGSPDTHVSTGEEGSNVPVVHEPTRKVKKPKTTVHADTTADAGPVVVLNGEDVSDYV